MERLYFVLFIGLAFLGHTLSEYGGSGDGGDDDNEESTYDEEEDNYEDQSSGVGGGDNQMTDCQQQRNKFKETETGRNPECQANGHFAPRQCWAGSCWCVDQRGVEIEHTRDSSDCGSDFTFPQETKPVEKENLFHHPGVIAGVIGGIVICLLCAVLVVMFVVYRMKKKDEGSYILGRAERKNSRSVIYTKAVPRDQEFYA